MTDQLTLLHGDRAGWELDEATKKRGRKGIAEARAAIARARRVEDVLAERRAA